ncbi:MAG: Hsp20/alpha crystallin family protein [Myxococcaceae bacterium]|nr:Hsp20/alpha crystallin family protein [Myxococcaceae bacterium]
MLTKWTPFEAELVPTLFREADRLFEGAVGAAPPADIYETNDELRLRIDLPGYDPKNMNVEVENDVLTVTAQRSEAPQKWVWSRRERAQGQVARSFVLPRTVDAARCEAEFEHGVLTLTLPKREESKPRSITVKVQA